MVNRYWPVLLVALLAIPYLGAMIYISFAGDKIVLLWEAKMWLSGTRLYEELIESNPPLVIWLYGLPVRLGTITGLSAYTWLILLIGALAALSCALAWSVIRRHPLLGDSHYGMYAIAGIMAALFLVPDFITLGDREHIFILLTLPYLLSYMSGFATQPHSLPWRILIAGMAAVGFCIKPHCAVVWMACQLYRMIRARAIWRIVFSLENCIILAGASLYLLAVWLFAPGYYTIVLPLVLSTYKGYAVLFTHRLVHIFLVLLLAALALIDRPWRVANPFRNDIYYILAIIGGCIAYALANNGWHYTYYPLYAWIAILATWVILEQLHLRAQAQTAPAVAKKSLWAIRASLFAWLVMAGAPLGAMTNYVLYGMGVMGDKQINAYLNIRNAMQKALQETPRAGTYMALDISMMSNYFIYHVPQRWVGSFVHLFMLYDDIEMKIDRPISPQQVMQRTPLMREFTIRRVTQDIARKKPDMVFIHRQCIGEGSHSPLLAFFETDAAFRAAWKHYRHVREIGFCNTGKTLSESTISAKFDVYRRKN